MNMNGKYWSIDAGFKAIKIKNGVGTIPCASS
jgi:hypothetical protein